MPGSIRSFALILGLPIFAVALVTGTEAFFGNPEGNRAEATELGEPGYGPDTYEEVLNRASLSVAFNLEKVSKGEDEWVRREGLARSFLRRSQLTGDFDDLARAVDETRLGMDLAPQGSGPMLTWATVAMSTHDLAGSQAALTALDSVAVAPLAPERSEMTALRGDIAFYRGDLATADTAYRAAEELAPGAGTGIRFARLAKARGDFATAARWLTRSSGGDSVATPHMIAMLGLQLGAIELARGEYAAARKHFQRADQTLPGYWLVEAHLAQSKAVQGDLDGAIDDLHALATRTQSPDIMDALANLLRAAGRVEESRNWSDRAGTIWDDRMKRLPEAAIGHALEHELAFGSSGRAVELGKRNLAIRPYGEAHLLLAQAYMMAGEFERARAHVESAKATGWRSAPLFAIESEVLTVLGDLDRAATARELALGLNPRIFDPETALIWFSHG